MTSCRSPSLRYGVDEAGIKVRFSGDVLSDPRQHTSGDSDVYWLCFLQQNIAAREVSSVPYCPRDCHWTHARLGELCGIVRTLDSPAELFHVAGEYGGREVFEVVRAVVNGHFVGLKAVFIGLSGFSRRSARKRLFRFFDLTGDCQTQVDPEEQRVALETKILHQYNVGMS